MAGVFPKSNNVLEFKENLFDKVNMVLPNRRWDYVHPELPVCSGTIPEINKYDNGFFGVHERQSHSMDTLGRIFQEKAVEAILDAGLNPSDLEGTKTGVYVGVCASENDKAWYFDNLGAKTFAVTGSERSMIAHRLSYFLKLKGPSYIMDTACSSSCFGMENAYRALRLEEIDNAIVGGTNLCLHPFTTLQFLRLGVLSEDGACKAFDIQGNGYARSEGFGVIILQKKKNAKRIYAQVVHAKTNCDGYKEEGITYPSKYAQTKLLSDFYKECGVDRYSLSFLEAHGTGTKVGDPEECAAIDKVLTSGRKKPLLIGSVKSNIGHSEPASGLCSAIKCILAMETGYIPPNINFNTPKSDIIGLMEGRMNVVVDKMPLQDDNGLMGINNFGFGGANAHILLKWNPKKKTPSKDNLPRLVCISGRTREAVSVLLNQANDNETDVEYIKLLHEVFRKNINNHLYRGYTIVPKLEETSILPEFCAEYHRSLYFAFGELDDWYDIGKQLMALPIFSDSIQRIQKDFISQGIRVPDIFHNNILSDRDEIHVVGCAVVQMAIVCVLNFLDIKSNASVGYSLGQLTCDYYNKNLTLDEAMRCAFIINEASTNKLHNYLTFKENATANGNCNYAVNDNNILNENKLFNRFKELLITNNPKEIRNTLLQNITNELRLSGKGMTPKKNKTADRLIKALTENGYHRINDVKLNSVILKIGDGPLAEEEDISIISLFGHPNKNHLDAFLSAIGNLYVHGYNPQIGKLYPQIDFPVGRGTPMISPYIKWEHTREKFVPQYSTDLIRQVKHGVRHYRIQVADHQWAFIAGHVIDGRNLFPATGYLYMVWETFTIMKAIPLNLSRVTMENCKFIRATSVPTKGSIVFRISIRIGSGDFEVVEDNTTIVTGRIRYLPVNEVECCNLKASNLMDSSSLYLDKKDIYKELRLRGYNYSGEFRSIEECNVDISRGYVKWHENWIAFMDNMLQMKVLQLDTRLLYVPVFISKLLIAADVHREMIKETFKHSDTAPNLPVYNAVNTGTIKCGGITVRGLIATPITRKKNPETPVLERCEFVSNNAKLDLHKSVRINIQIMLENAAVYKVKAVELIDQYTNKGAEPITPIVKSTLEDEPLVQPIVKILSEERLDVADIEVENTDLGQETDCLLIVGSEILKRPDTLKQAFAALKENGFIISREKYNYDIANDAPPDVKVLTVHQTSSETMLLLQRRYQLGKSHFIKITCPQDFSWLSKVQDAVRSNSKDDIVLYAEQDARNGIMGLVKCLRREPDSRNIRCVFVMDEEFKPYCSTYTDQLNKNMTFNVYRNGEWGTYRHLLLDERKSVNSERCFVTAITTGDLSSLRWIEGPPVRPETGKELVYVYYSSLNFKDLMISTGKISADTLPDRLEQDCNLGFEFSGRDSRGNRIMGSLAKGALTNLLLADPLLTYEVPDTWTLEEAATIPVVYTTVLYALIIRGHIRKGESVLIHSGTGGIGQAAIRLALYFGCRIFTTVGTQAKREFLMNTYPQIKDEHIGNSHDVSFEQMVYKGTKGRGVDVVLNSLAEDKLVASVRCLSKGGRFLEIGKFDLSSNNHLNLLLFQKHASFHGVMLDKIFNESPYVKYEIKRLFQEIMKEGAIKPLNRNIFENNQIEKAFRFMATGKHTGKVLIKIRELEDQPHVLPSEKQICCLPRYYCDPHKVYMIIGGLGGFGLELADWLILRGSRKLILTSRNGITTGYQRCRIRLWKSYGVTVKISTTSITNIEDSKRLIEEALRLGDVAAIFNLAVVLADAVFENQTSKSFVASFEPKAFATEYLDDVSRKMCPNIREFVVFSSVSCGRGNAGQTNYGMANSVMERLCEKRQQDGYPALAVEWGAVGDVGLVAEMQENHTTIEISGTVQQRILSCLQVLDTLLTQKDDVAVVSSMIVAKKQGSRNSNNIIDAIINIIGLQNSKCVSLQSNLAELGMDSMTAIEIKQVLERDFEIFLSSRDMRTMTLARLKEIQERKEGVVPNAEKESSRFGINIILRLLEDECYSKLIYVKMSPETNDKLEFPKVILLPGIEGFAKVFKNLAVHLNEAVALQYVLDGQTTSVAKIVESLAPTAQSFLIKDKPFTIVAYSYGTLIALEMVRLFESRGLRGTLICIDGAPLLLKYILQSLNAGSEQLFQTNLMCQLLSFYIPNEHIADNKQEILKCETWEERVNLGLELVKNSALHQPHYLRIVANTIYKRLKDLDTYMPSYRHLKSNIKLFKPSYSTAQNMAYDYGLSHFFDNSVEVRCFQGNHETILEDINLALAINSYT